MIRLEYLNNVIYKHKLISQISTYLFLSENK